MKRFLALAVALSLGQAGVCAEIPRLTPLETPVAPPEAAPLPQSSLPSIELPALPQPLPEAAASSSLPSSPALGDAWPARAPAVFPLQVAGKDLRGQPSEPEGRRIRDAVRRVFEPSNLDRGLGALGKGLAVAGVFIGAEIAGSLLTHSVSLRADALHSAADWSINATGLAALAVARWRGRDKGSAGKLEATIGMASAGLIALTALELAREALQRFLVPQPVAALEAAAFALCGVAANLAPAIALHRHQKDGVALKGIFMHAATDVMGSLAVAAGGVAAWALGCRWIDPAVTALVSLLVAHAAWSLGRRSWDAFRLPRRE